MVYPNDFEEKIDFLRVREAIKNYCLGEIGQWLVDKMQFMTKFNDVQNRLIEVDEFMQLINSMAQFPTDNFFDMRPLFDKMRIEGTFAEVEEIFALYKSLITVKEITRFFKKEENAETYPKLAAIAANVAVHTYVIDSIEHVVSKQGRIRDNASPELARIRREQAEKQGAASKLIRRIIAEAQHEGWVDPDVTLVHGLFKYFFRQLLLCVFQFGIILGKQIQIFPLICIILQFHQIANFFFLTQNRLYAAFIVHITLHELECLIGVIFFLRKPFRNILITFQFLQWLVYGPA